MQVTVCSLTRKIVFFICISVFRAALWGRPLFYNKNLFYPYLIVMRKFTKAEIEAIKAVESALAKCYKLGLEMCGMNDELFVAHKDAVKDAIENPSTGKHIYNPVASACERYDGVGAKALKAKCYIDSGAW